MATMAPHRGRGVSPRLVLVLAAAFLAPLAGAIPWQQCGNSANYSENSAYQANIKVLSDRLPKNASSSGELFAKDSVGAVPDIVYALALCRGDTNASACASCIDTAFQDGQQLCPYIRDVTIYYDTCYLRFSNANFLANTGNDNAIYVRNQHNVTSSSVRAFDAAVAALLNATADYAAANSTRRFATAEGGFDSSNPTIYGLTQCTPDMSSADCRSCLTEVLGTLPLYFSGRKGARFIGVRCNFRYEVYSFFTGSPSLRLPPPLLLPPAPSPAPVNTTPTVIPQGDV